MVDDLLADRLLIKDDASAYLETLTPGERRARYDSNGLPEGGASFNREEIDAAFDGFCPQA